MVANDVENGTVGHIALENGETRRLELQNTIISYS